MTRLRVGFVIDDATPPQLLRDLLELGAASAPYSVELLLVQGRKAAGPGGGTTAGRALFRLLTRIEQLGAGRLKGYQADVPPATGPPAIPRLRIPAPQYGQGEAVARIREHGIEVLVCLGTAAPAADVRRAAALATVAVRFGRGPDGPPGFREVLHRTPASEFSIERLSPGDAGDSVVLLRGALNTAPLYAQNARNLVRKAAVFTHRWLEATAGDPQVAVSGGHGPGTATRALPAPALGQQLTYLGRTFLHFLERSTRRLAGTRWRWGVAYQFTDDPLAAVLADSTFIQNPPHRYFADPFVASRGGRSVCFVEDYDCRTSKARITALEVDVDGHSELGVALEEPFHLSFPYVFSAGDDLFMCPETAEAREIRLYRCTEFPLKWEFHRTLMKNVAAVDTCICFHDGRWWLLSNIDSAGIDDYRSELHLFHADAPDSDRWQPHPANPVLIDSFGGRNGGLFAAGGALYRVGQVHGFDVYGESMRVARVTALTRERYAEEVVATIEPDFAAGIVGTHTLSWNSRVLALDYVRRERCRTSASARSLSTRARRS